MSKVRKFKITTEDIKKAFEDGRRRAYEMMIEAQKKPSPFNSWRRVRQEPDKYIMGE